MKWFLKVFCTNAFMEGYKFESLLLYENAVQRLDPTTAIAHTIGHMHFEYQAPLRVYFSRELKLLVLQKDNSPYGGKCESEQWIGSPAVDAYDSIKRQTNATPMETELPPEQVKIIAKLIIEGIHLSMAEQKIMIDIEEKKR